MKNLHKAVGVMGTIAGVSVLTSMFVAGCSGDDTSMDAGKDATQDNNMMTEGGQDGMMADVDAGPDSPDTGDPLLKFRADLATAFCNRFQSCCTGIDGGPFDYNLCMTAVTKGGVEGSSLDLVPNVTAMGNITFDSTQAQNCISNLSTLSCPVVASMEWTKLVDSCFKAAQGKIGNGANCLRSTECQPGSYCNFMDAGTNEAGTEQGKCAALLALNAKCGQLTEYSNNFSSEECQYRGWPPPARFCNYDSLNPATYFCDNLRANGVVCYTDNECASGLCVDVNDAGTCDNNDCQCQATKDFTGLCKQLKIKDAGPG